MMPGVWSVFFFFFFFCATEHPWSVFSCFFFFWGGGVFLFARRFAVFTLGAAPTLTPPSPRRFSKKKTAKWAPILLTMRWLLGGRGGVPWAGRDEAHGPACVLDKPKGGRFFFFFPSGPPFFSPFLFFFLPFREQKAIYQHLT